MIRKKAMLYLLLLTLGFSAGYFLKHTTASKPVIIQSQLNEKANNKKMSMMALKEDEDICPIKIGSHFIDAKVTFLPVPIDKEDLDRMKSDDVGKRFDPVVMGKDLYKYDSENPWQIEELDIDGDLKKEKVYYGKVAMNHTPHVAYLVKDGLVIFIVGGANIQLKQTVTNGFKVSETLDWNIGKYKTTKYEYTDKKFKPVWYQISCDID